MIFYFTGTGNSFAAAKAIAEADEPLISIAEAARKKEFTYELKNSARIGFVFPEYCSTVPEPVTAFIRSLEIHCRHPYVFAIITRGGVVSFAAGLLRHELAQRRIRLHYACSVRMPNNAVTYSDTPDESKQKRLFAAAEQKLSDIRETLRQRPVRPVRGGLMATVCQPVLCKSSSTVPFRAEDSCVSCGACARNCPDEAIRMEHGRPVWVKATCAFCHGCINRCPAGAIEYGTKTPGRRRYVHPDFQ
ncbi:MAG: EFR1 family ferrodoxin [Oscillospiraceae bacterium]|nr:EFR1 family ferrodoxin [Oscillospiraceae bacterium]